jgi:lysyl-tRNA synthetase class 2
LASDILASYGDQTAEQLEPQAIQVKVAGRIRLRRLMGKASFVHLQDMSGHIQLYVRQSDLPEGAYDTFKNWDIGDIVGAEGTVFKTKTGELSVKVTHILLLTKALRPLPDKYHGLTDQELCYRQRYVDLITNDHSRKTFLIRSAVVQKMREYLYAVGFLEVETPMMHPIPGGAIARPFTTHHNALDIPLYLRVAPELYLKRLVVGGLERVFELNRNFRNEGVSTRHNPEFTMLEFYQAYADYADLMVLTEDMLRHVVQSVLGHTTVQYQGKILDFALSFRKMTVLEAICAYNTDIQMADLHNLAHLRAILQKRGLSVAPQHDLGQLQIHLFEETVESKLIEPTFITQYPTSVSPLARKNNQDDSITDRFEFFIMGREIANGYSELNDPLDQAERFRHQTTQKEGGNVEAMHFDADYITALEYGLPPTAGTGIGIDRFVMLLTDSASIKDVILFPLMKPI